MDPGLRSAITVFLAGDVLAALAAGTLISLGQTALGIAAGILVVLVATTIGARRLLEARRG